MTTRLAVLAVLALMARVLVVWLLASDHAAPIDYEHGKIAENLLEGRGFSVEFLGAEGPTSQQAPFYPFFLASVYAVFGVGTTTALFMVQLIQCVVGTALVLAVVWLGWTLVPDRPMVGWIAGIGAAIYPTHLYMVTHLQVALWAALLLTLLVALVTSRCWQTRWSGALLAGGISGVLLLVEPILALTLPICAAVFWMAEGNGRRKERFAIRPIGRLLAMAGVASLIVSPWIVRNWRVHGEFVFVKSTFGYAFWQANNPISWGTDKVPKPSAETLRNKHDGTLVGMNRAIWEARHETLYIDDVLLKPTRYREFAGLSEPQRSRLLGHRAWSFVRSHPTRYAQLCMARLRYFLLFDETNPKASNRLYRAATVTWLVLASIGLLICWPRRRGLWPTFAIFAVITLFHTLVITSVRFRIPLEPLTFIWAAATLAAIAGRWVPEAEVPVRASGHLHRHSSENEHALKGPHWSHRARKHADRR